MLERQHNYRRSRGKVAFALVIRIVEVLQDNRIVCRTVWGNGTCFRCYLPVKDEGKMR